MAAVVAAHWLPMMVVILGYQWFHRNIGLANWIELFSQSMYFYALIFIIISYNNYF